MNYGTDYKRNAYILQEGETEPPEGLKHAWKRGLDAREIIRTNIIVGRTARETLSACASALEKAGYVYTPYTDFFEQDKKLIEALEVLKSRAFQSIVTLLGIPEIAKFPSDHPLRLSGTYLPTDIPAVAI